MPDIKQMLINEQYLTVKKIGEGGFGVVWRAYDFSLRNYIAIKELLKEYNEPKYIEMLYREALIAKNIIHENIVRVQHFWRGSNGSYYISMDYVAGKDLEHLIQVSNKQNIRIPWELCVLIAGGILKAIDFANRLAKDAVTGKPYGLIYRDISPGNVILSFDGNVKLSDFGIAKTADEMSDGIKRRVVTGKYSYMSPEQIKGDPDVDHRSDIFSIGVVLYEMLTGTQLYTGDPHEIKDQITGVKFDPSLLDNMNLPFELAGIVEKALEKDKDIRYEKAIEIFRDLRRLLKGKETEELTENLAEFIGKMLPEELAAENRLTDQVRHLNIQDMKNNPGVIKVSCKDFIVGDIEASPEMESEQQQYEPQESEPEEAPQIIQTPVEIPKPTPPPPPPPPPPQQPQPPQQQPKAQPRSIIDSLPSITPPAVTPPSIITPSPAITPPTPITPITPPVMVTPPPITPLPKVTPTQPVVPPAMVTPPPQSVTPPVPVTPSAPITPPQPVTPSQTITPAPIAPPVMVTPPPVTPTPKVTPQEPIAPPPQIIPPPQPITPPPAYKAPAPSPRPPAHQVKVQKTVPPGQPVPEYPAVKEAPARPSAAPSYQRVYESHDVPRGEEKGKTVFEEVGDWLVNKFKVYRNRMLRLSFALLVFLVLFAMVDTFAHITPFGKKMYSLMYPPDVVIVTVPTGATVSLRTRAGKPVITDGDSSQPIELRKIPPGTYMLSASKQNFRTVERVIRIEDIDKDSSKKSQQRIEVNFNFTLAINSVPPGADVFVDGTKFNVTPCRGEFIAGEHTVKIAMKGFEDLGALAKEVREGQCNIDFTKPNPDDAFGGIDKRYWAYQVQNAEGGAVFTLTGTLFKKVSFTSVPSHAIVHLEGESQARGNTPLTVSIKAGEYKARFMDPEGKFDEGLKQIKVNQDSDTHFACYMNKWITIKVRSLEHHSEELTTKLKITGPGVEIDRSISTGKPLRFALPLGIYKFVFEGDNEYRMLILKNVDIANRSLVMGEMEYENTMLKVIARDHATQKPINEAFVWMNNKVLGKTNETGVWENEVLHGTATIKVVAKGYIEKTIDKDLAPKKDEVVMLLTAEAPVVLSTASALPPLPAMATVKPQSSIKVESNLSKNGFLLPRISNLPPDQSGNQQNQTQNNGKQYITCPNCGKVYEVVPGKKLRFCINCGKPFY